jgi:hypothetical protein
MAQTSQPFDGQVLGDAGAYSSAQWANMYQTLVGTRGEDANLGVFRGYGTELRVVPTSPASAQIEVGIGAGIVQGRWFQSTATENFIISANASGFSRIDRMVLSVDYVAQTVRLVKLEGTPSASPALPALTQVAGTTWQIPLANILVVNAFVTIAASAITDERIWINAPDVMQMPVINQSASILNTGNLVRRDTGTGGYPFSITTTTSEGDNRVLGIIMGRTAASGGAGYVVTQGVIPVICDESVAIGDYLESSTTAGQAQKIVITGLAIPFGVVLTANTGAGTACLAYVNFNAQMIRNSQIGNIVTGTYTGNGGVSRAITGLGFQARYLIIYDQGVNNITVYATASDAAGNAKTSTASYSTDMIISLDSDGFTVGDGTPLGGGVNNFNVNARVYTYIAMR